MRSSMSCSIPRAFRQPRALNSHAPLSMYSRRLLSHCITGVAAAHRSYTRHTSTASEWRVMPRLSNSSFSSASRYSRTAGSRMSLLAVWAALFSLYPARIAARVPFMSTSHSRTKRFCLSVMVFFISSATLPPSSLLFDYGSLS